MILNDNEKPKDCAEMPQNRNFELIYWPWSMSWSIGHDHGHGHSASKGGDNDD